MFGLSFNNNMYEYISCIYVLPITTTKENTCNFSKWKLKKFADFVPFFSVAIISL